MKKKLYTLVTIALFLVIFLALLFRIYNNIKQSREINIKLIENNQKYERLKEEKEKLQKELEESRKGINKEKFVRDNLNLKKDGERIYKIVDEDIQESESKNKENGE
ncbi:septum formation initiator family protein [Streptobacillus notomytis]|uniref:septum formation initiator family protein n=1 Tax=Streptobacillus notomytis TaxID=1712031 RepID=UPI000834E20B|nr:septum formation initiator family protein [Streptobacillus notomytis]